LEFHLFPGNPADRVRLLLRSHGGRDEKADARDGRTQRGGFGAECAAGPVQTNQVEHHQNHDHRQRVFHRLLVSAERLLADGG